MPSTFSKDCKETFGSHDLYFILQVHNDETLTESKLKKAYYKQSMLWHPDRFAGEDDDKKEDATRRFQVISKAYNILNDPDKKQLYDSTGILDDESWDDFGDMTDWSSLWQSMFKPVTKSDIDKFFEKYRGSAEETADLIKYYNSFKGNMDKIIMHVLIDDEERVRFLLNDLISRGEIEAYDKFVKEPEAARIKRQRKREKEAREAEKTTEKMRKKSGKSKEEFDIFEAFAENRKRREESTANMIAEMERKYGGGTKRKAIDDIKSHKVRK